MNTRQRVQNRIQQIRNTMDTIRNAGGGSVTLDLIDFSTDTSETKQTVHNIQTPAVRDQLIQTLVNREYAFVRALSWYDYINERIIPGGFTYDLVVQFVKYYVARWGINEHHIVHGFINHIKELEEAAKEESKGPASLRY